MTQAALKLRGPWEVRRKFRIPTLSDAGGAAHVEQALNQVTGVKGLAIELGRHLVKVRYETTETDYTTISNALNAIGLPPKHGWWADRKASWLQGLDVTSRENAGVRPSPCCNKPPPGKR